MRLCLHACLTLLQQCKSIARHAVCNYAGAFFKDQGIQYTCVAGQLVAGNREAANRTLAKYACNSYREVRPRPSPLCASYQGLADFH